MHPSLEKNVMHTSLIHSLICILLLLVGLSYDTVFFMLVVQQLPKWVFFFKVCVCT